MRKPQTSRALFKPPALVLVCATVLAVVTVISWNFICRPRCSPLALGSWEWVAPLKVCAPLLLAASLTFFDNSAARVVTLLLCCYVVFDIGLGAYAQWQEYAGVNLHGTPFFKVVLWQSMMPLWKGALRLLLSLGIIWYVVRSLRRGTRSTETMSNKSLDAERRERVSQLT